MGLRINTNVAAFNTTRQLNKTTARLSKSLERLSSGLRINRAADDAAGLAIAEAFRSQVKGLAELAVQAASGTVSTSDRAALQAEVSQLISQIDDIATDTEFNGTALLDGTTSSISIQAGAKLGQTLSVSLTGAQSSDLGLNAAGFFVSAAANAATAIQVIDSAILTVSSQRATLGAAQNRLGFTVATLAIQQENSASSESAIRDANIALETIDFTRNQILMSAGTSILAQANVMPQTALTLLT